MMISITKKFDFCYAHYLPHHRGKCIRLHGHNAILEIEVGRFIRNVCSDEAGIDKHVYNGMVVDFGDLKEFINKVIIEKLDHQHLNEILPYEFLPPTAENICRWVWIEIDKFRLKGKVIRVRVYETPTSYAEIKV